MTFMNDIPNYVQLENVEQESKNRNPRGNIFKHKHKKIHIFRKKLSFMANDVNLYQNVIKEEPLRNP